MTPDAVPDPRLAAVAAVLSAAPPGIPVPGLARLVLEAADAADPIRAVSPLLRRLNASRERRERSA